MKNYISILKYFWSVLVISLFEYEMILLITNKFTNIWFQLSVILCMVIIFLSINYAIKKNYFKISLK